MLPREKFCSDADWLEHMPASAGEGRPRPNELEVKDGKLATGDWLRGL